MPEKAARPPNSNQQVTPLPMVKSEPSTFARELRHRQAQPRDRRTAQQTPSSQGSWPKPLRGQLARGVAAALGGRPRRAVEGERVRVLPSQVRRVCVYVCIFANMFVCMYV